MSKCCGWMGRGDGGRGTDPVVDIERLLVNYAWDNLAEPSCWDRLLRRRRYQLDVNWSYLDISHRVSSFRPRRRDVDDTGTAKTPGPDGDTAKSSTKSPTVARRNLCLFRTVFENTSALPQNFTFKTERSTTSRCDFSMQRGFRIGAKVDVRLSLPAFKAVVVVDSQVESSNITGGLSGELHVTKATGQTFEEKLTWSVDSQVSVAKESRTTASLLVREQDFSADLTVDSVIRPLEHLIPVYVRHRRTGRTLELLDIASAELPYILTESAGFTPVTGPDGRAVGVRCETKGIARLVYAAEQVVDIRSEPIGGSEKLAAATAAEQTQALEPPR